MPAAVAQESENADAEAAAEVDTDDVSPEAPIDADAIAAGTITRMEQVINPIRYDAGKHTLQGRLQYVTPKGGALLGAAEEYFSAVNGMTVYAQWVDGDGAVSPVYQAQTHNLTGKGDGVYVFKFPKWKDANGKEHTYGPATDQKYRVWAEPTTHPDTGNPLVQIRSAGGYFPGAFTSTTPKLGATGKVGSTLETGVWMHELPGDYMKAAEVKTDPKGFPMAASESMNAITGRVWLESTGELDLFKSATYSGDPNAREYTVYASVPTEEGAAAFDRMKKQKPVEEWAAETKRIIAEHPEYVRLTVKGKTDANGQYALRFPDKTYFNTASLRDNIYMWVEDRAGDPMPAYTSFANNVFQSPAKLTQWAASQPVFSGVRWNAVDFAVIPHKILNLDITNFDTTEHPAQPGDTAKLKLNGRLPDLTNKIEWRDGSGKVLKTCEDITSTADLKGCENFQVPANAKNGSFFRAVLVSGGKDIAADSFIVEDADPYADRFEPSYEKSTHEPGTKNVKSGEPSFKTQPTEGEGEATEMPEGTKFALGENAPEGATIDENTGVVTLAEQPADSVNVPVVVTYPDETTDNTSVLFEPSKAKTTVEGEVTPVDPTDEEQDTGIDVKNPGEDTKVSAKDEDGKDVPVRIDDDGNVVVTPGEDVDGPITVIIEDPDLDGGKTEVEVPVNGHEKDRDDNESETTPSVVTDKVTGVEGQEIDPFETAKDIPENGKVEVNGLPEGLTVDSATGEVTGTPEKLTDWGKDEETRDVTTTVTIKGADDGTVAGPEEKVITIQRDTDGDGTPDVTDEDDDDDGYTDKEEKEKGSDPKDSNSIPATVIDPVEGVEITNGDQTVVEGNPIEDVTITPADKDAKVTVDEKDLPKGVDFDPESNKISGTPEIDDWDKDEEERDFEISVTVENKDGSKKTEKVTITVQRDTDKDGKPDVTDEDDDDDGVSDEVEKEKGSDPKDPNSIPATVIDPVEGVEITNGDQTVVEGNPIEDVTITPADKDAKVTVDEKDLPKGVDFDSESNKISGTPEIDDWGKDEEERDFEISVTVENKDGSKKTEKVTITVQRDTDKDGKPDVTDEDDDDDGYTDKEEKEKGSDPKDSNSIPATVIDPVEGVEITNGDQTVVEGNPIEDVTITPADKDAKVTVDEKDLPKGVDFDPESNKISGTPEIDDWDKDEEERDFEISVTVENPDGSKKTEKVTITVQRDTDKDGKPDVTDEDDDDDGYTDKEEKEKGSDPKDSNSIPATVIDPVEGVEITNGDQTVVEGNPIEDVTITPADKDAKVTVDEKDLPKGVDFDPESNKISGTPEIDDWDKDEEERDFEISVTVENKDGSKKTEKVTITVQRDTDKDGKPDVTDEDDDDDGVSDEVEKEKGSDPKDPNSKPSDDNGEPGDNGSSEPADIGKCIAAGVGLGLPLLLLAPLGLAGQVNLPGVSQWQAQIEPQIRELNTRLQQEAGLFNPELARMAEEFNAQMARPEVRAAVGGIGLLLAGLAIGGIMLNACAPEGGYGSPGSSDLKPIGSGENESEGSSQPEAEDANGEDAAAEEEVTEPEAEEATDEDTTDPEA